MPVQRFVDSALAVAKESVKTFTYEAVNNIVRLINGVSALLLVILPGKNSILEGMSDWELRPSFRAPKLPRWMENGVSSFNQFIHDWSVDSDTCSSIDYSSEEEYSDESTPGSPMSHCSHFSTASSFTNSERHWMYWIRYIISWITLPMRFLLGIPFFFCNLFSYQGSNGSSNPKSPRPPNMDPPRRLQSLKEHVIQRATDRRRGVVEDLHVAIEIFIESIFDFFHKAARCLFAPLDTFWVVVGWFYSGSSGLENYASEDSVTTSSLSETDPTLSERKKTFYQSHNSDTRTCQDVITELGYPYEAIRVVTSDGYVLLLERIPRRDSRKVVYLQHGVLDSSMGWVSNGVVGSLAFAAYDQGFDVFLGNLRGLVSKEHVVKNISTPEYWRYSINEHGTEDIPAMIEKIHEIKVSELPPSSSQSDDASEESNNDQPYKLCAICHSLGGAAILIYIITRRILEKPHRLSRMILLSPAGFHHDSPFVFTLMEYIVYLFGPLLAAVIPALYIPTRVLRMITNKLARDFHNLPAVGAVVQTMVSYFVGGDSSNWVGVLGLPHYNMNDMPGVSMGVMLHLAQIKRAKRFIMFDHGSPEANMKEYGSPEPLDLGEYYQLIDIPVDLVAGRKDKIIRASMIRKHYKLMKTAGVQVSYNEFEYAHLDFTFSHREELLNYVMSRLLLVSPSSSSSSSSRNQNTVKSLKLKKRQGVKNDNISEESGIVVDDER